MPLRRVNLTVIVVLGYFVRFKRVGDGFDTFSNVYNQLFGAIRVCPLSFVTSLLVTSATRSTSRGLEPGQLS